MEMHRKLRENISLRLFLFSIIVRLSLIHTNRTYMCNYAHNKLLLVESTFVSKYVNQIIRLEFC